MTRDSSNMMEKETNPHYRSEGAFQTFMQNTGNSARTRESDRSVNYYVDELSQLSLAAPATTPISANLGAQAQYHPLSGSSDLQDLMSHIKGGKSLSEAMMSMPKHQQAENKLQSQCLHPAGRRVFLIQNLMRKDTGDRNFVLCIGPAFNPSGPPGLQTQPLVLDLKHTWLTEGEICVALFFQELRYHNIKVDPKYVIRELTIVMGTNPDTLRSGTMTVKVMSETSVAVVISRARMETATHERRQAGCSNALYVEEYWIATDVYALEESFAGRRLLGTTHIFRGVHWELSVKA